MPNSVVSTKFLQKRGEEPRYSTEEFWAKFTYQIIGMVKINEINGLNWKEKMKTPKTSH